MYETQHLVDGKEQKAAKGTPIMGNHNYTDWSDVFICPSCSRALVFWEVAVDKEEGRVRDGFTCPHCGANLTKRSLERATERVYDRDIGEFITRARQVPVLINYSVGNKRFEKKPDQYDLELIRKIEESEIPYWYPTDRMPEGYNTEQPKVSHGITHVHHFYTRRNLWVLAALHNAASGLYKVVRFWLTSIDHGLSKRVKHGNWSFPMSTLSGTLYVPALSRENNPLYFLRNKSEKLKRALASRYAIFSFNIGTQHSGRLSIGDSVIDYIFTDPPFGGNLMYSELNFLWEAWLRVFTNNKP